MVKTMDRNDSINLMKHTLSVRTLKNILSALDDDLKVVMASNYGDYTHTTQLVSIDDIALSDAKNIEDSRYSESGSAYYRDEYVEEQYNDELTAAEQVLVLTAPSVAEDDGWEMRSQI